MDWGAEPVVMALSWARTGRFRRARQSGARRQVKGDAAIANAGDTGHAFVVKRYIERGQPTRTSRNDQAGAQGFRTKLERVVDPAWFSEDLLGVRRPRRNRSKGVARRRKGRACGHVRAQVGHGVARVNRRSGCEHYIVPEDVALLEQIGSRPTVRRELAASLPAGKARKQPPVAFSIRLIDELLRRSPPWLTVSLGLPVERYRRGVVVNRDSSMVADRGLLTDRFRIAS